jgi:hypothetical protein
MSLISISPLKDFRQDNIQENKHQRRTKDLAVILGNKQIEVNPKKKKIANKIQEETEL